VNKIHISEAIEAYSSTTALVYLYRPFISAIKLTSNICIYHKAWVVRSNQKPNITGEQKGNRDGK